ncbi:MAG: rhodanese-like domain-containing protein [Planctomycetaceae bacterium]|nr:rhodanese-like domain-containing protein [Planctomycetaceae bacterium]
MSNAQSISVQQLCQKHDDLQVDLIDVRTPVEFREVHADVARNVPLDALDPHAVMKERNGSSERPLYVICRSGARGAKAQQKFVDAGYTNVINVEGGTEAWVSEGLPATRGKKAMSLERQVRIAAGSIVFAGAVAAMVTGNVYLAGIPAFVGAGLVFAGVTDTCAMGMLIAKMPWNQVCNDGTSCAVK